MLRKARLEKKEKKKQGLHEEEATETTAVSFFFFFLRGLPKELLTGNLLAGEISLTHKSRRCTRKNNVDAVFL
jgi:hypothetical protein